MLDWAAAKGTLNPILEQSLPEMARAHHHKRLSQLQTLVAGCKRDVDRSCKIPSRLLTQSPARRAAGLLRLGDDHDGSGGSSGRPGASRWAAPAFITSRGPPVYSVQFRVSPRRANTCVQVYNSVFLDGKKQHLVQSFRVLLLLLLWPVKVRA